MYKTKITITKLKEFNDFQKLKTWNYKLNHRKADRAWEKLKQKYKIDNSKMSYDCKNYWCTSESFETPRGLIYKYTIDNNAI